jgi:hypothetical protein
VLFSVGVLSLLPIAATLGRRSWRLHRAGDTLRGAAEFAVFLVVTFVAWWYTATTPAFANTREQYWPPFETPANAVGDVLLNATHRHEALWLLSIVVVVGIFAARRYPVLRLIVAGHLVTTFLYVLTAAINRPDTRKFTGYWYNDAHRLAAMLPITAVPLAVGGIVFIAAKILARTAESTDTAKTTPSGWRSRVATTPATTLIVVLTAVLVVVTGGLYPKDREVRVAIGYQVPEPAQLVPEDVQAFYQRIKAELPADALVAGNPFNGSAMLWTLADREVLYPHFRSEQSPEQDYLASHLDDVADDPKVCPIVRALGVDYLLIGGAEFRRSDFKWEYYRGLDDPGSDAGFELVDSDGDSKLYRITACGSPSSDQDD